MATVSSKVRLGIIGCGKGAELCHLPAISGLPEVRLVAAADIDEMRLQRVADRFAIAGRFTDFRTMLDQADLTAVAILTPPRWHTTMAEETLSHGKHLFIDKPLALTLAECDHLLALSATHPELKVLMGYNFRFLRLVTEARRYIEKGLVGDIRALHSTYTHWHPGEAAQAWHKIPGEGGGVICNDGVHHFDLWRHLLDSEVATISATCSNSPHFQDATASITARMANGIPVSAILSYETGPESTIEIFGSKGRLTLSHYRFDGLQFHPRDTYPGDIGTRWQSVGKSLGRWRDALEATFHGGCFQLAYRRQWQHFADCILREARPLCTLLDGRMATAVALSAMASIAEGSVSSPVMATTKKKDNS